MNYLAHIHLASITETSLVGNFAGDFVRGSVLSDLPEPIQQGIKIHRKVDSFTDRHDKVRLAKQGFPAKLRRTAGICLDIWFDHLLLLNNERFPPYIINTVLQDFYQQLAQTDLPDERFNRVKQSLLRDRWLAQYEQEQTCLRAFYTVEQRLGNRIVFARDSYAFLQANRASYNLLFLDFYPELIEYSCQLSKQVR
ncbi:ACP phosphodiesterase [Planctobacterium marinum]|uniref:ACP phosphodiesterase n=1 Tax=Planctobacterium marinum TaxID=1631968 RepID=A0AA48HPP6_9ALTE|nr:ACP phosphodiesterase [Planctobacterium marinum]